MNSIQYFEENFMANNNESNKKGKGLAALIFS
ncbi:MAG: hypothetical protein RIS53_899 [Bacillota bacterium]